MQNVHFITSAKGKRDLSYGTRGILQRIDRIGKGLLDSGKPWEDGMLEVESFAVGLPPSERLLVSDWIWAWRGRIVKANGQKSRPG